MDAEGPNFEGCNSTVPIAEPKVCGFPKDRGSGKNYTMFWFFDMEYGGCSRYVGLQTSVSDSKTLFLKALKEGPALLSFLDLKKLRYAK